MSNYFILQTLFIIKGSIIVYYYQDIYFEWIFFSKLTLQVVDFLIPLELPTIIKTD